MPSPFNKLRSFISGQMPASSGVNNNRHPVNLEPEIGFQILIDSKQSPTSSDSVESALKLVPELHIILIAARHLPTAFGFKMVHGYNIKVKLFPGSQRFESSIQTNSWPKFNESFKFPLLPVIKPSLKAHKKGVSISEFLPEEVFTGHFVVFTVYALLELPPANFNRFNRTYKSLRERSSSLVQKVVETRLKPKEDETPKKSKIGHLKSIEVPQLTASESKRNIGSVTCYLEPKIFKRNTRTGQFCTEELWLPIRDITTTLLRDSNNLVNSTKGVIEIILEVQDMLSEDSVCLETMDCSEQKADVTTGNKLQWTGFPGVRRRLGKGNIKMEKHLILRVFTSRMRCSNKVKDELESSAGSVYIKTTLFEHNIYSDSWKSGFFFPSLSTKWDNDVSVISIPINQYDDLKHIHVKTSLVTKNKLTKKIVLGTIIIGQTAIGSGFEHWKKVDGTRNERIAMWHSLQ